MRLTSPASAFLVILSIAAVIASSVALHNSTEPEPTARERFEGLTLPPVRETLVHVQGEADDVYEQALGYYFLNFETGAIEGWYDPGSQLRLKGISEDNRLLAFTREEPQFIGGIQYQPGTVLVDRQTGHTYGITANYEVITSGEALAGGPGQILVRHIDPREVPSFAVVTIDPRPHITATFDVPRRFPGFPSRKDFWAVFSPGGSHVAVLTEDDVLIVDLVGGERRWAESGSRAILTGRGARVSVTMNAVLDGKGFIVTKDVDSPIPAYWRSYDWKGELLAQGEGIAVKISPDGTLISAFEPLGDQPWKWGPLVLNVTRSSDGEPVFRIVGVTGFVGDNANVWLADNSGVVVGDKQGRIPVLVLRSGEVFANAGLPSRTSPHLFAHDTYVADRTGAQIGRGRIDSSKTSDFFPPWGLRSDEVRFMTPQLGYDYAVTGFVTQPHVELAPFAGPPRLRLAPHATGVPMRDAPLGNVIGTINTTGLITVLETQSICSQRPEKSSAPFAPGCATTHHDEYIALANATWSIDASGQDTIGGIWAHVVTADGQRGWILFAVSTSQL